MFDHLIHELGSALENNQRIIPSFKNALAKARVTMASNFEAGVSTDLLIKANSDFMDDIMRLAWNRFKWTENRTSWRKSRISLLAVGGYGRQELLPNSDIDLLILLERNNHSAHRDNIQSFTTLLWDIGLEVGHSVRSIAECKPSALHDVTILTAMMESRTILGDGALCKKVQQKIAPGRSWSAKSFYLAKRQEQNGRHEKSNHTEYSLEPNVKTSPGGLRDIQTLTWVARRRYGTQNITELAEQDILTLEESEELIKAQSNLWKIRFALHLLTNKDENRLLFEYQQALAGQFGFTDNDQLAVEQFMQSYYRTAHRVNTINETLLQHFDEVLVQANTRLQVRAVNDRFRLVNNLLEVTSESVFADEPSALLEMFVIVGSDESIGGFRASTIRLARHHVYLIDTHFRENPKNAELFMTLLGSTNHLFTQLRRMGRWGILGAYLPEFGRIIGQMQFDLFHIYTVDAHTLQVVRNMRRFRYKNNEQKFPIAAHIHPRLPRIDLLYIAGLYHDIAKGMGGDHSELGIEIADAFCKRHKLATWDTNLVRWLVQNHLVMSTTAQRKDIQDPEIIHEFARFVGEQVRLDYLYALTVADINATNPTLWNGWRASLMEQLYSETKKALRHGLENPIDRNEYIQDVQLQALDKLKEHKIDSSLVRLMWNQVDEDYFVRERVSDIVWHADAILEQDVSDEPIILIRDDISRRSDAGFTQIFIHTHDRKDLFVSIVTAINQLNLSIVDARIATSANGLTFNTFTVLENDGQPVGEKPTRIRKIRTTITDFLAQDEINFKSNRRIPRLLKQFKQKTRVNLSPAPNHDATSLEVTTPDRPGLLAVLAKVFVEVGISLISAKITTLGERVEDVFYITDQSGSPITDPASIAHITDRICETIDHHVEQVADSYNEQ
jgi:[protein-PII] uridylyltransferase